MAEKAGETDNEEKTFGILFSLALMLVLTPLTMPGMGVPVYADAEDASPYGLWVCGVAVTETNKDNVLSDGIVSFTPATADTAATLTLKGNVTATSEKNAAIYYTDKEHELIINAEKASVVTGPHFDAPYSETGYGIFSGGPMTVRGKLETSGGNAEYSNGIYASELVIDDGAEVKASGSDAAIFITNSDEGKVDVKGKLTVDSEDIGLFISSVSDGVITINDGAELNATGWTRAGIASEKDNAVVIIDEGAKVSAAGGEYGAINGIVKNAVPGLGWKDAERTGTPEVFETSESGHKLDGNYKYVEFREHAHSFTYSADGAAVTATCSSEGCPLPVVDGKHVAKVTIAASDGVYDGRTAYGATITDEHNIRGDAEIKYFKATADGKRGDPLTKAPVNVGKYWAEITLGPGTDDKSATAHVIYTVAKATPTIDSVPSASDITYGQTLSDSTLTGGMVVIGDTGILGAFTWKDGTIKPSVADSQATDYDVVFTPNDSDNYDTAECMVKLTVNRKEAVLTWTGTKLTYNGREQAPEAEVTEIVSGDEGQVIVTVTGGQTDTSDTPYTATADDLTGARADNYTLPNDRTTSFTISPRSISGASVTLSETSFEYTGESQTVSVTSVKLGETELSAGTEYTVSGDITGANAGTYTVTVTGKGNYTGSATAQWSIKKATPAIVAAPSASDITCGQTLSDSTLTGGRAEFDGAEVQGTFIWKNSGIKPSVDDSGKTKYTVVFTPDDTTNYRLVETEVTLNVKEGEPEPAGYPAAVGTVHAADGSVYVVTTEGTVSLVKAKSRKSFTLPAKVRICGKTFIVTGINARAFKGTKVRTLTVRTKGLSKATVRRSLKGSKVKTVKVKVGKKKTNRKYVKKYRKIFTKKNCGRKVTVRR